MILDCLTGHVRKLLRGLEEWNDMFDVINYNFHPIYIRNDLYWFALLQKDSARFPHPQCCSCRIDEAMSGGTIMIKSTN